MDVYNPTADDLRSWAYDADAEQVQDFELFVTDISMADIILELAADPACPNRRFFLSCLYLLVGNNFRAGPDGAPSRDFTHRSWRKAVAPIREFVERSQEQADPVIRRWAERSLELFARPRTIVYDEWCDGGIARAELFGESKTQL